uniref:Uncharacterized protein n=1 Tax=Romanomermis culicivorax TaxID=13658 RepID=A0A915JT05_ROMCU
MYLFGLNLTLEPLDPTAPGSQIIPNYIRLLHSVESASLEERFTNKAIPAECCKGEKDNLDYKTFSKDRDRDYTIEKE